MAITGRTYTAGGVYRYGFNGKENDNEVKGDRNQQDYGMRIYDNRLGRFLSVDPLMKSYPMLTPYQFTANRPIDGIDLDGQEYLSYFKAISRFHFITLKKTTTTTIVNNKAVINVKVTGIESGQGSLLLENCSGWLRDYCNGYNNNMDNWHDEGGNPTIGTKITWLGSFNAPQVSSSDPSVSKEQKDLETFAKSPVSPYGRGTVPNVPTATQRGPAGNTTTGGGKIGGAIKVLTTVAVGYAKYKAYSINKEAEKANDQFKEYGWRVIVRLDYAIQQNYIPERYAKDERAMAQIANFFLYGDRAIENDSKLLNTARELYQKTDNLYYEEQKTIYESVGDGNGGNTGRAPIWVPKVITIRHKI